MDIIGRIGRAATIDSFVADTAAIVGKRDVVVIQGLPHAINLYLPTPRALVDMAPGDLRRGQGKGLTSTNTSRSGDSSHQRLIVYCHLHCGAISHATVVFGEVANPIIVVGVWHIVIVESVITAVLRSSNLPTLVGDGRAMVLYGGRGQVKTTASADGRRRGRSGNGGRVVHMDLNRIADIAATVVAHLIMQVPVVISNRDIVDAEWLVGAVLRLAGLPSARTVAVVGRRRHVEVFTGTNRIKRGQRPSDIRSNVHNQLAGGRAIDKTAAAFHHVADVPAVVGDRNIVQAKGVVITCFRW